ncbi:MAG TPA: carbohydrate ABC transporter permease [Candidatus Limnocylindrales bacterium]|nr:carbohydrate ABC transporter permease [Candidatus Limnocylindrales bacterium]
MTSPTRASTKPLETAKSRSTTRRRIHWRDIGANWLAFTVIAVLALPALWIVLTAFRPNLEVNASPPIWIPQTITLGAFESLFGLNPETASGVPVMSYLTNSLTVALLATALSVPIGTAAGYAFSRFDFMGSRMLLLVLLLTRAVPGVALSLPLFLLMRNVGLIDTVHGLAFVYMALNIPFTAWLMDGFFRRIPRELDDAAYVDGASNWQTFWKVDLPLALPGLGAAAVFAFLAAWNEYQIASIITKTPASKTFPVGLSDFTTQFTVDWRGMAAMSVLMMIPAILFVLAMQRSLTKGLTFGAVKG